MITLSQEQLTLIINAAALRAVELYNQHRLIGATEAAKELGVSFNTFARIRLRPDFPKAVEGGKYKFGDIKEYAGLHPRKITRAVV